MSEKIGIIKDVGFGCRDVGYPILFFSVYVSESVAALQILHHPYYVDFIKEYGVWDIKDLEGKPVWVEDDDHIMKVLRPCTIKGNKQSTP